MKRKILGFALTLFTAVNTFAFAAQDIEIFCDGKISIQKKADKNSVVTAVVLKGGVTLDEFNSSSDTDTLCFCYREINTGENGEYTVSFDIGEKSGRYELYTGTGNDKEIEHSSLRYINKGENEAAISNLLSVFDISDALQRYDGFEKTVVDNADAFGINITFKDAASLKESAKIFFASVSKDDVKTFETAKSCIDKAMAISLFNGGKISFTKEFAKNFSLPESVEKYLEKPYITDETRTFIEEKTKKTSADFESFDKTAAEAVALGVIYSSDGSGGVKNVLIENASLLGIDSSKVTDAFAESIVGKKFDSIESIGLDSFAEEEKPINRGGGGGGGSKNVSGSVISGADTPVYEPIDETPAEFVDLAGFEWAKEAIESLRTEGIVNGRQEGIFAPSETVLREEFLKMLLSAVTFENLEGDFSFDDVSESDWYYNVVRNAYLCKIVNGISESRFGSGMEISRQDMALMCYNALVKKGIITDDNTKNSTFADSESIAPYARDAVSYLSSIKIVNGDENLCFNPNGSSLRAEAAQMIYNIIRFIKNR